MRTLSDVPTDRLMVECDACRRRGSYRMTGLVAARGAGCELRTLLCEMRDRCGATPCHAHLVVPMRLDLDRIPIPGNTFAIDIWETETSLEMALGRTQVLEVAYAAFDQAVALWPHSIITVRLASQVLRAHRPGEAERRAAEARILRGIGLMRR